MFGLMQLLKPKLTVEMVHADFDGAADEIVKTAEKILSEKVNEEEDERLGKLTSMGFVNVPETRVYNKKLLMKNRIEKILPSVQYYQKAYPHNKFVTEDQVKKICLKYGLCLGKAEYFKGSIPVKNQLELANFKVQPREAPYGDYLRSSVFVAGQKEEFETYGLDIMHDYLLTERDPIVLFKVKDGYLVITAWGGAESEAVK